MPDLTDVARRIFHASTDEEIGAILANVDYDDLPEVSELLRGMEARRIAYLDQADAQITEHGWTIQGVIGSATYPWFAYSVGLWPNHGAEFVVRGFDRHTPGVAHRLAEWVVSGDLSLIPGRYEIPNGPLVQVEPWRGDVGDFGMANRRHKGTPYPKMHVLVADNQGRLPGEPGCEVEEHQMRGLP